MKKVSVTALFLGALAVGFSAQPAPAQVQVNISIGGFYDELSPYGEWVDCSYGDCWVPERVEADWQPYTNGEWIYTEYGWTWVSYDPWGDDPYHYGTWTYIDRYGWAWVPGTVWAPAWVTWSYSDNYVGWAPLPPNVAFGYSGYAGRPIVLASTRYVFVPTNRFFGSNVRTVRVSPQQSAVIFRQTTPITRFGVTGGIVRNTALPIERIQRATRTRIETRNISTARTAPRPITGWTRDSRRQVSIVAPAREVRAAIASRPQRGSRSTAPVPGGNERMKTDDLEGKDDRRPETRVQEAPARSRPETSNAPVDRGRRSEVRQQPQPAAPPAQPQTSNAPAYRGRAPEARPQPQAAAPPAQPNPNKLEKPQKGRGPEKSEKPGKGKAKNKDKDKDKDNP
jgi:hypothetical protein